MSTPIRMGGDYGGNLCYVDIMGNKKPKETFVDLVHSQKLSLRKLAAKTGIHYTYLCHMGRGRRMPTLERALKIARALKTTPDHLFRLISV